MSTYTSITATAERKEDLPSGSVFAEIANEHIEIALSDTAFSPRISGTQEVQAGLWIGFVGYNTKYTIDYAEDAAEALSFAHPDASFVFREEWAGEEVGANESVWRNGARVEQEKLALVPVPDAVAAHLTTVTTEAGLPIMAAVFSELRADGTLRDEVLLRLTANDVGTLHSEQLTLAIAAIGANAVAWI